ncbi:hypothetical protein SSCH_1140002 [Syntrophaceticus schinkii]|uniref:Uncharacterized protein n=1 Tax=Syntrophaceticus schinkii TaxID=499207 RepID=A0A0B7MHX2_9FIRM|nr:hypothetical protein SSCH_1140002 [Syntrophaceticus schinkii]
METKLTRIAEKARENPKLKFTTLVHLINEETLMQPIWHARTKSGWGGRSK